MESQYHSFDLGQSLSGNQALGPKVRESCRQARKLVRMKLSKSLIGTAALPPNPHPDRHRARTAPLDRPAQSTQYRTFVCMSI